MSSPAFWPRIGTQSEDPRETVLIITAAKSATLAMDDDFAVGAFPFSKMDDWREFTAETAETDPWGGSGDCKVWPPKVDLVQEPAGSWHSQVDLSTSTSPKSHPSSHSPNSHHSSHESPNFHHSPRSQSSLLPSWSSLCPSKSVQSFLLLQRWLYC